MGEDEEKKFKFVKMKKHVLKVHIHCQGCEQKVRKLVGKIEGVYQVKIERELQKVSVWGNVECTTLINKLVKSGKHAELWRAPHPSYDDDDDDDGGFLIQDEWDSYVNNHHIEMDQGVEDDITMGFPDYDQFNIREEEEDDIHIMSFPNYNALPQFNTHQNSYLGYPLYDYHNRPMNAPWYSNYPYSMMYHQ